MSYPNNCFRGIPNDTYIIEDGTAASFLFYFKDEDVRSDGWIEQSINWEDDDLSIKIILGQTKKNGEIQFKEGVAKLPRNEIDRLIKQPSVNGILSYERQPLVNNPYHGNLLLQSDTPKLTMKKIAAGLALVVSEIIPQESLSSHIGQA
ncbi:MAG: hypothetical protein ISS57_14510 [Anaerolineales bacterium]|nr:hypothetical protein [bacterium]MBL7163809.1 hypothetical protein [Anaerolineales bacterium]